MNLLQIFFIISGIIITFLAVDIARKEKFNALHFFVFISIGIGLLVFTFFPDSLNGIGKFFGLQRGADLLVYASIIFLIYFVLLLLRKVEENKENLTLITREIAINNGPKIEIKGKNLILLRAYNEGSVIKSVLEELLKNNYQNILVINDGSVDNTLSEINSLKSKSITVISHYKNRGGGAALETGFEYIRRYGKVEYLVTFDADGQHCVGDLKDADLFIKDHKKVNIFLGSRFLGKRTVGIPIIRKIILKGAILFTAIISKVTLSDSHNGFRVFRTCVLSDIKLTIDGMGYASELIDIISTKKIPYKEIPVNIKYTKYSLSKGQKNGNALKIALRIIWNKFFK